MTLLLGGLIAVVLGLVCFIFWFGDFLTLLKGALPLIMVVGGGLTVYLGVEEIQSKLREERERQEEELARAREEIELIKARAEQYREELERLKEQYKPS